MVSPKSLINLRQGNPGNSGRAKSAVREAILGVCDSSTSFLADVAAGKRVVIDESGVKRRPTLDERMKAIGLAYRCGLGREDKLETGADSEDSFPVFKIYHEVCDPILIGIGETYTAEQFVEGGRGYIGVLCEDGIELRYRIPLDARPIAVIQPRPPPDSGMVN